MTGGHRNVSDLGSQVGNEAVEAVNRFLVQDGECRERHLREGPPKNDHEAVQEALGERVGRKDGFDQGQEYCKKLHGCKKPRTRLFHEFIFPESLGMWP